MENEALRWWPRRSIELSSNCGAIATSTPRCLLLLRMQLLLLRRREGGTPAIIPQGTGGLLVGLLALTRRRI